MAELMPFLRRFAGLWLLALAAVGLSPLQAGAPDHRIIVLADAQPAIRVITAGGTTFDSRVTYTGASLKMDVDATGKLTYGPNNRLIQSNTFTNAAWLNTNITVTSGVADPDGGTSASTLTATANGAALYINATGNTSTQYLGALWVRRRTGTGTVGFKNCAGSDTNIAASLTGGAWFLASSTATSFGDNNTYCPGITVGTSGDAVDVYKASSSAVTYETTPSQRPTADRTITTASAYYGPRFGYDPVTLAPLGYDSEEARTNLELQSAISNATWSKSNATITASGTAPDGTSSSLITATASPAVIFNTSTIAVSASTTYAVSFHMKPGTTDWGYIQINLTGAAGAIAQYFNLTTGAVGATEVLVAGITVVGAYIDPKPVQGHYRGIVVITTPAGTTAIDTYVGPTNANSSRTVTVGKTISAWGADVEATSANYPGPTSYIPTTSATVTRAADVASITVPANYNQAAGTWLVKVTAPGDYNQQGYVIAAATDGTHYFSLAKMNSTITAPGKRWINQVYNAGVQSNLVTGVDGAAGTSAIGAAYATNDFAFYADGSQAGTDTSGTVPAVTTIGIGIFPGGTQPCDCHIKAADYYNLRLPNAKMQQKLLQLPLLDLPRIPANDNQPERMAA